MQRKHRSILNHTQIQLFQLQNPFKTCKVNFLLLEFSTSITILIQILLSNIRLSLYTHFTTISVV
jgi:hypothetical protein